MVNRHFETPEYLQLFGVKLTPARKEIWDIHYPHYIKSRRDCWGAAAVHAPLDVKRAIRSGGGVEAVREILLRAVHRGRDVMESQDHSVLAATYWKMKDRARVRPTCREADGTVRITRI